MRHAWVLLFVFGCGGGSGDDQGWRVDADLTPNGDGCVPLTCEQQSASCGNVDDGCGGVRACGDCLEPATCGGGGAPNVCAIPEAARECREGWCWEAPAPSPFRPAAIAAVSATDAWAVGSSGTVIHFDGTHWSRVAVPTAANLHGVWMASATDGWIVGDAGTVLRWNGAAWTAVAAGAGAASLRGVHGRSASDVWIVGTGASRRFNGATWTSAAASTPGLTKVLALAGGVFAIGEGRVWEHTGVAWIARTPDSPSLESYALDGLVGTDAEAYAVGHQSFVIDNQELVYRWDGSAWASAQLPDDPWLVDAVAFGGRYFAVHNTGDLIPLDGGADLPASPVPVRLGTGAGDALLALGTDGEPFQLAASTWSPLGFGYYESLASAAVIGDTVWFGGTGRIVEWRGGILEHAPPAMSEPVVAIAGTSPDDVWAVDNDETFWSDAVVHWDGTTWTSFRPPSFTQVYALDLHAGEVRLVGEGIHRLTGRDTTFPSWEAEPDLAVPTRWRAAQRVGEELYLAGESTHEPTPEMPHVARLGKLAGGAVTELPAPAMAVACGIHVGAPNDIWVAGYDLGANPNEDDTELGAIAHWDGAAWTMQPVPGAHRLCTIVVRAGEVWITGPNSGVYRASGGTWALQSIATLGVTPALVDSPVGLWAAGSHGAIVRRAD